MHLLINYHFNHFDNNLENNAWTLEDNAENLKKL